MNFICRKKTVSTPIGVNGGNRFAEKGKLENVTPARSERRDVILIDGTKYYREDFAVALAVDTLSVFANVVQEDNGKRGEELYEPTLFETEMELTELIKTNAPEDVVKAAFLKMGAAKGKADALEAFEQRKDMQERLEKVAELEADAGIIGDGV